MVLMALRWNWANTLPIAIFCLWSIIAIGGGWTDPGDVNPLTAQQTGTMAALPAHLSQAAAQSR